MTTFLIYIGHGRALELFLGFYKVVLALSIMATDISARVPALSDLTWSYPTYVLGLPFLFIGSLQLIGLRMNAIGYESSWIPRFAAASLAMILWAALLLKSGWLGQPTLLVPMAISALPASAFLIYKSWNRLPVPGAVGLV